MAFRRFRILAATPATLEGCYGLFDETVVVETNHPAVLAAADTSFGRFALPGGDRPPIRLLLLVDPSVDSPQPASVEHRTSGSTYLVVAPGGFATVDLGAGAAAGLFGQQALADRAQFGYTFIEGLALAILTYSRGYFSIHAAGIASAGAGVAVHGQEGAGKSTLAVACARAGLDVFAEDAVFVHGGGNGTEFWGLPWLQRLLPSARDFFPELTDLAPILQASGELKLQVDLDDHFPGRARVRARPAALVALERATGGPSRLEELAGPAAHAAIELVWPWEGGWGAEHEAAAAALAELPVYRLHMNGTPDEAVELLRRMLAEATTPAHR